MKEHNVDIKIKCPIFRYALELPRRCSHENLNKPEACRSNKGIKTLLSWPCPKSKHFVLIFVFITDSEKLAQSKITPGTIKNLTIFFVLSTFRPTFDKQKKKDDLTIGLLRNPIYQKYSFAEIFHLLVCIVETSRKNHICVLELESNFLNFLSK